MPTELQTKFEAQLPKLPHFSFERIFHYVAGLASIIALVAPLLFSDTKTRSYLYIIFLTIIVLILLTSLIYLKRKRLNRYAQSLIFTHYVNHVIRDAIQEVAVTKIMPLTVSLLDAIATCFSVIIGERCRACLVELKPDYELKVTARDGITKVTNKKKVKKHFLEGNTDFSDLWYARNGRSRYFLSNDLPKLWLQHKYVNSSFEEIDQPEVFSFFSFRTVVKWNLPYKSALVLPIRYISSFAPPETTLQRDDHWNYWGFLCVDCNSKRVFDENYCPELGGAFADALFTLFSHYNTFLNEKITQEHVEKIH
ncbi:hypothetical protein G9409_03855 [Chlorobium sp. BLA1]|uniref:hypothetical protein n=1 Tax=Candidatus Chlorobium masyuteum TaxID=2716876 RepID=UPI00141FD032|nr:hypothetical protein [Candidatus Chlorobium masyuteum]NHQ59731.1 hypothetical protein [Candidatus Chlorobium masyuteum]